MSNIINTFVIGKELQRVSVVNSSSFQALQPFRKFTKRGFTRNTIVHAVSQNVRNQPLTYQDVVLEKSGEMPGTEQKYLNIGLIHIHTGWAKKGTIFESK